MQYKGYVARVEYDEDDRVLHGRVDGINAVVTFVAENASDLEREFRLSVDEYLAMCADDGVQPEKPYSGRFLIRSDVDTHRAIAAAAAREGKSVNAWAVETLRAAAHSASAAPGRTAGKDAAKNPQKGRRTTR